MAPKHVLVLNTSEDTIEALRACLEFEGYQVTTAVIRDLRNRDAAIRELFQRSNPDVVIFDVAPPYEPNWRFFQELSRMPEVKGRPVILTSTNVRATQQFTGAGPDVLELLLKPFDLGQLVLLVGVAASRISDPAVPVRRFGVDDGGS